MCHCPPPTGQGEEHRRHRHDQPGLEAHRAGVPRPRQGAPGRVPQRAPHPGSCNRQEAEISYYNIVQWQDNDSYVFLCGEVVRFYCAPTCLIFIGFCLRNTIPCSGLAPWAAVGVSAFILDPVLLFPLEGGQSCFTSGRKPVLIPFADCLALQNLRPGAMARNLNKNGSKGALNARWTHGIHVATELKNYSNKMATSWYSPLWCSTLRLLCEAYIYDDAFSVFPVRARGPCSPPRAPDSLPVSPSPYASPAAPPPTQLPALLPASPAPVGPPRHPRLRQNRPRPAAGPPHHQRQHPHPPPGRI